MKSGSGLDSSPHGGRQGDAGGAEREARGGARRRADEEAFPVLLDLGLPDLDGKEVARRIHARRPSLPVIFMTGHGDTRGESMLQKPFELKTLDDLIARYLPADG